MRPGPKPGPVTVPGVPEYPGQAATVAPRAGVIHAIHCGVLKPQRRRP